MLEATLLALGSAVLHAGWNLLVKTSDERFLTAWGQFVVGGIVMLPVLLVTGLPPSAAVPYLAASSLVHVVYVAALVRAYHHADFSFAYPLARGGGALLAAIGGVAFLSDDLSTLSWLAIAIVVAGLASLVRPHVGLLALGWALLTALTIGIYTTLDAAGARRTDSGLAYGIVLVIGSGAAMSVVGVARGRGASSSPTFARRPVRGSSPAGSPRSSPTRWCWPRSAWRRSATSRRCASLRWCWAPPPGGCCSTSASAVPGWSRRSWSPPAWPS